MDTERKAMTEGSSQKSLTEASSESHVYSLIAAMDFLPMLKTIQDLYISYQKIQNLYQNKVKRDGFMLNKYKKR